MTNWIDNAAFAQETLDALPRLAGATEDDRISIIGSALAIVGWARDEKTAEGDEEFATSVQLVMDVLLDWDEVDDDEREGLIQRWAPAIITWDRDEALQRAA